jgi:membrane protein
MQQYRTRLIGQLFSFSLTTDKNYMKEKFRQLVHFFTRSLWRVTESDVSRSRYTSYNLMKIIIQTVKCFIKDRVWIRAAALSYTTLFSIIPIMALLFAIAKGFGFTNIMEHFLRNGIVKNSSVDMVMSFIDNYLEYAKSGVFIGVGIVMLLWAVIALADSIETNMNTIWEVKKPRSYFRKLTDYMAIFIVFPLIIVLYAGVSIFMTTIYQNLAAYELISSFVHICIKLAPYALSGLIMTGLFLFIPNTKVKFKNALIPGMITGIIFQAFLYIYIQIQMSVSSYNAIYGSFAIIPMFMLWADISWSIILFGVEMSYVSQNIELYNFGQEADNVSRRYHDFLCVVVMSLICKRFEKGEMPYTASELSDEGEIPIRLTGRLLDELENIGLIHSISNDAKSDTEHYLPAMAISQLSVGRLLSTLESHGCEDFKIDHTKEFSNQWDAFIGHKEEMYSKTNEILLKDL